MGTVKREMKGKKERKGEKGGRRTRRKKEGRSVGGRKEPLVTTPKTKEGASQAAQW